MKFDRITIEQGKMNGQPCIRGYRLTVRRVLRAFALLKTREELFRHYPELDDADLDQAMAFAAAQLPFMEEEVRMQEPALTR